MRIIAITTPKVDDEDVRLIRAMIGCGIDTIHLRKPDSFNSLRQSSRSESGFLEWMVSVPRPIIEMSAGGICRLQDPLLPHI